MRSALPIAAMILAGCGSRGSNASAPNWGYVVIDNVEHRASAAFLQGAGLDPVPAPITRSDECVAFPVGSSSTVATAVDAGVVTIAGAQQVELAAPGYAWTGTTAISTPGESVGVSVQGSLDVPPVISRITSPYPIAVRSPTLADGLIVDPSVPLALSWTSSDCSVGFRLANSDVSLECSWSGSQATATIPPQLLGLLHGAAPSPATLSLDCANWQHATAADWDFTVSLHAFFQQIAVSVE